jgi:hypothetical protein
MARKQVPMSLIDPPAAFALEAEQRAFLAQWEASEHGPRRAVPGVGGLAYWAAATWPSWGRRACGGAPRHPQAPRHRFPIWIARERPKIFGKYSERRPDTNVGVRLRVRAPTELESTRGSLELQRCTCPGPNFPTIPSKSFWMANVRGRHTSKAPPQAKAHERIISHHLRGKYLERNTVRCTRLSAICALNGRAEGSSLTKPLLRRPQTTGSGKIRA